MVYDIFFQTNFFPLNLYFSTLPSTYLVSHLFNPAPDNMQSHQPTSLPVLPAPLSILGVCGVGCIPIASEITPISSPLSVLSACPQMMLFSNPLSLSFTVLTVLLLTLPPVYEIYPISSALTLTLTVVVSGLIS